MSAVGNRDQRRLREEVAHPARERGELLVVRAGDQTDGYAQTRQIRPVARLRARAEMAQRAGEPGWTMRKPLEAVCQRLRLPFRERHEAPTRRCQCGIYAALPETARDYFLTDSPQPATPAVVGCVSLWGLVVECERGWRASHAYPERLFVPTLGRFGDTAARVARGLKGYGVPVELLDASTASEAGEEIASLARVFNRTVPGTGGAVAPPKPTPHLWRQ